MQTPTHRRFVWGPLLPGAMVAATLIYAMTSVLAPDLIDEFGFTKARVGWILAIFSITSAAASPIAGRVTDRIGSRAAMLIIFASSGIGFLLFSQGVGFYTLAGATLIIAFAQALGNPATNKLIATQFEAGERGLITGIKQSGVQVGTLVAGLSFAAIAAASSWRTVPILAGLFMLALALYGWRVLPPDARIESSDNGPAIGGKAQLPRSVPLLAIYALLMGLGGSALFGFMLLYAVEQIDISDLNAGFLVAISGAVGTPARIGAAILADRTGKPLPLLVGLSGFAVASALALLGANAGGYPLLIVGAVLSGVGVAAWNSVAMLAVINDAGPELAGRASGVVLSGFLSGLAISPPIFGYSVDATGSYNLGLSVVGMLFAAAAIVVTFAIRAGR